MITRILFTTQTHTHIALLYTPCPRTPAHLQNLGYKATHGTSQTMIYTHTTHTLTLYSHVQG